MYRSRHAGEVDPRDFGASKIRATATMGKAIGQNAEHPEAFLRKHAKEPVLPQPTSPSRPKEKLKAPVPARTEKPIMGLTSNKNFITTNAVEVILAAPKKVPKEEKLFVEKPGFGTVPAYLKRNKQQITLEQQQLEQYLRLREQPSNQPTAVPMSEEERGELLRHLKIKWATLNAEYQKLGFVMDIGSKVKRHEAMEAQLAEIERDIRTLEAGDVVLVVPDNGSGY
ncbi:hypothetical protein OEZ85_000868 [Tetradesmus obliquus]|uniref:Enkurin domain-containing protein n=1 Tax=Tetradesmus obliquus TaxID=3088 RepID=A0ABY8UKB3_TETOB|nr:hypothetical protein OEZ85_000868 [Tetradesmus obliquus]